MSVFVGQLYRNDEPPIRASVQIEDGRVRIWTDRRRLVSWDQAQVTCERTSVFRFQLSDGYATYDFQPGDPAGFSDSIGAVVDLRAPKSRFGLAERIRQAQATQ
jgi:hypothetical protein